MKKYMLAILASFVLLLSACSADEQPKNAVKNVSEDESKVVTIDNNGTVQQYDKAPTKAISLNQHVTEIMLALGLEDSMVGTAYLDDEIYAPLKEAYDKVPVLADGYPSKEQVIDSEADFLYGGWKSAFGEKGVGTPEELEDLGIHSYLQTSSTMIAPKLDNIFEDIRAIATIFRVDERGEKLIADMTADVDNIKAQLPQDVEPLKVLVFDSGGQDVMTASQNFMNELVTLAGGHNIFGDIESNWTTVSKEDVVERAPEVIVIIDYGETTAQQKIEFLKQDPALSSTPAVQKEHFVILPLSAASEGVRAAEAINILAKGFYPESFKK